MTLQLFGIDVADFSQVFGRSEGQGIDAINRVLRYRWWCLKEINVAKASKIRKMSDE